MYEDTPTWTIDPKIFRKEKKCRESILKSLLYITCFFMVFDPTIVKKKNVSKSKLFLQSQ